MTTTATKGQLSEIGESFKLLVFVLVFLINLAFWSYWAYHFVQVLVRNHFKKFKKVCSWLSIKVESKVLSYEKDLQRELDRIKLLKEDQERAKHESVVSIKER